jgi:RHS repeat-associated protein
VNGPDGTTEAVQNGVSNSNYTYNIIGNDNIGQAYRVPSGITRYYYLKDHLGSVRMVVKSDGTLDAYNDYYPYGMQMPTRNQTASADARYKFTGKERDAAETGYDWFEVRGYDSRIGRFLATDPHANKYPGTSPYVYCGDNPIGFVDPTGKDSTNFNNARNAAASALVVSMSNPALGPEDVIAIGILLYAAEQAVVGTIDLLSSDNAQAEASNGEEGDSESNENEITKEVKERAEPGADGATSVHIKEKQNGETISVTHAVKDKTNVVIHQHQTHIGKYGGQRRFPEDWIENKTIPKENNQ